jgi:hypothetical protein
MKLIINERQAKLLNMLNESSNVFSDAESIFSKINEETNRLYNSILYINIYDLISGDLEIKIISDSVSNLDRLNLSTNTKINNFLNTIDDKLYQDNYEETHHKLDDMYSRNNKKLNMLDTIIHNLKTIADLNDDYDESNYVTKLFSDATSINL